MRIYPTTNRYVTCKFSCFFNSRNTRSKILWYWIQCTCPWGKMWVLVSPCSPVSPFQSLSHLYCRWLETKEQSELGPGIHLLTFFPLLLAQDTVKLKPQNLDASGAQSSKNGGFHECIHWCVTCIVVSQDLMLFWIMALLLLFLVFLVALHVVFLLISLVFPVFFFIAGVVAAAVYFVFLLISTIGFN